MPRPCNKLDRAEYCIRAREFALRGESAPSARLTAALVKEIRDTAATVTARQWAERLGVHYRTIEKVRAHETWAHVRGAARRSTPNKLTPAIVKEIRSREGFRLSAKQWAERLGVDRRTIERVKAFQSWAGVL